MWNPTSSGIKPVGHECRSQTGVMAQRKGLCRRSTAAAVPLLLLGGMALGGAVFVSNQVVALRLRVADLQDRREFLEAAQAGLCSRWNDLTAAEVIRARAADEIGLVPAEEPGRVLALVPVEEIDEPGVFNRFLSSLGGGGQALAASGPAIGPDGRARALPRAADPVLPRGWGSR